MGDRSRHLGVGGLRVYGSSSGSSPVAVLGSRLSSTDGSTVRPPSPSSSRRTQPPKAGSPRTDRGQPADIERQGGRRAVSAGHVQARGDVRQTRRPGRVAATGPYPPLSAAINQRPDPPTSGSRSAPRLGSLDAYRRAGGDGRRGGAKNRHVGLCSPEGVDGRTTPRRGRGNLRRGRCGAQVVGPVSGNPRASVSACPVSMRTSL